MSWGRGEHKSCLGGSYNPCIGGVGNDISHVQGGGGGALYKFCPGGGGGGSV